MAAGNGGRSRFYVVVPIYILPYMMECYRREFLFKHIFSRNKFILPNVLFVLFYWMQEKENAQNPNVDWLLK